MLRSLRLTLVLMGWLAATVGSPRAEEYRLLIGDVLKGEVASATEEGLVVKLDIGGFSERVPWAKLTQETLKLMAKDPKTKPLVEPFIEVPLDLKPKKSPKKKDIVLRPVPRVEMPADPGNFMATVTAPFNLAIILVLFAANLYAAYEIAIYRRRPAALVCGISVLLPVLGPLLFLSLPGREEGEVMVSPGMIEADAPGRQTGKVPIPEGVVSSLSMAKAQKSGGGAMEPAIYKRSDTTFNRRFFEVKFQNYFRVVLSEAEKSMVIVVSTPKREFQAQRIARISSNEVHMQLLHGGGEASIPFDEITQVQFRAKDAKS